MKKTQQLQISPKMGYYDESSSIDLLMGFGIFINETKLKTLGVGSWEMQKTEQRKISDFSVSKIG